MRKLARSLILICAVLASLGGGYTLAQWAQHSVAAITNDALRAEGLAAAKVEVDGLNIALSGAAVETRASLVSAVVVSATQALPVTVTAAGGDEPEISATMAAPHIEIRRTPGAVLVAGPEDAARARIVSALARIAPDLNVTTLTHSGNVAAPAVSVEDAAALASLALSMEPCSINVSEGSVALSGAARAGEGGKARAALDALSRSDWSVASDGPLMLDSLERAPVLASTCKAGDCRDEFYYGNPGPLVQLASLSGAPVAKHPLDEALSPLFAANPEWSLAFEMPLTGPIAITGAAPDEGSLARLGIFARAAAPGREIASNAEIAPAPAGWRTAALAGLNGLGDLLKGQVSLTPGVMSLSGYAPDAEQMDRVRSEAAKALPDGWRIEANLTAAPPPLAGAACAEELQSLVTKRPLAFEAGSADLSAVGRAALLQMANVAKRCTDGQVEVGGHTDSQGGEDTNQMLSRARAETVVEALLEAGVRPGLLVANGYGEAEPVADNNTAAGRAQNRRIAFRLIGGEG